MSGVALDLVGAGVLSHAHNAESIVELRRSIGDDDDGTAVGEPDELATQAQLLAEKRVGFLLLTVGLVLYLTGLVLKSPESLAMMADHRGGCRGRRHWSAAWSSFEWPGAGSASRHAGLRSRTTPTRCRSSRPRARPATRRRRISQFSTPSL